MSIKEKVAEYDLMENSKKTFVKVLIPAGPELYVNHCWDYKTNLTETSFKTTSLIEIKHDLLEIKSVDLAPVCPRTIYLVTVQRREKSNLKTKPRK